MEVVYIEKENIWEVFPNCQSQLHKVLVAGESDTWLHQPQDLVLHLNEYNQITLALLMLEGMFPKNKY